MNNNKIHGIEFLRVFLIIVIVFHHMFIDRYWTLCHIFPQIEFYTKIKQNLSHAYNGVEGFFIISGFLLFLTSSNKNISIYDFIKKKYERLSPVIIFSIILCFGASFFGIMHFNFFANLATILLINQFGICIAIGQNPILWYTSTLFCGLIVYFYLIKKISNQYIYITFSVLAYLILNIINNGHFNHPLENHYHIFNIGFLRAMGGIGLGTFIGSIYKKYENIIIKYQPLLWQKICITLGEILSFTFVLWWLCFYHEKYNNTFFVIFFTFLFILLVLRKGYFSQAIKWDFGGKYQYSLYVMHYIIIKILGLAIWKKYPHLVIYHPLLPIVAMCIIISLATIFSYYFIERKKWLNLSKK